jgi:hypothetical protein
MPVSGILQAVVDLAARVAQNAPTSFQLEAFELPGGRLEQVDLERIARLALKDLGVASDKLNIAPLQITRPVAGSTSPVIGRPG